MSMVVVTCWLNKIKRFLEILSHIKNTNNKVDSKDSMDPKEEIMFQEVNASG